MSFLCGKWIFNWVSQKVAPVPNPKYNLFRICNAVILLRLPFGMLMIRATWPGSYNYRYSTVLLLPREAVFRIRIQGPRQKQPGSRSGNGFRFLTGSGFKEYGSETLAVLYLKTSSIWSSTSSALMLRQWPAGSCLASWRAGPPLEIT